MSLCSIFILKNLMKQEVVAYSLRVSDQYGVHQSCSNESCRTKMAWQMVVASANKPAHPLQNNVGLLSFWSPMVAWTKNPMTEWMNERKCIVTKRCPPQGRRHLWTYWIHIQLWKMPHFAKKRKLKQENTLTEADVRYCLILLLKAILNTVNPPTPFFFYIW